MVANFQDIMIPGQANEDYAEFVRHKIRSGYRSSSSGDAGPKGPPFGSKRIPCETGYYEVFNRNNVLLVDFRKAPIKRITPQGYKPKRRL
ncbi:MAG: hypothetical protein CM1200mP22_32290 [Dehalococcoidia bacterium]|nr:MAG: hypothetical protein CM1200mP22_32290 [Dehalococcoidia bacterium]